MDQENGTKWYSSKDPEPFHGFKDVRNVYCYTCSCAVTDYADADGRVQELADVALYLCDTCAEKEQKKTDIEKIGEYRILRKLGRGGLTAVYKVWHEPTHRLGALRVILPELIHHEWAKSLFEHEISVIQHLVHPNIVRLLDHKREEPSYSSYSSYSVYEYLPGGDLYTYAHSGVDSESAVVRMGCHILEGLDYVHQKGIVHRDIKPHNMFLTEDGTCKLSDFDLAKKRGEPEILKTDHVLGPIGFTAPEQIVTFEEVTPSADVYSVGVSLYYVLTKKFPINFPSVQDTMKALFKGETIKDPLDVLKDDKYKKRIFLEHWKAVRKLILKEDRIPIQYYRKDISSELAKIIDTAVMRDETQRFTSARQMRDALHTCV